MTKVYIITSGDYSSYCIEAVFSTPKKAKEFVEWRGKDDHLWQGRIETHSLDVAPEILVPLTVRISQGGEVQEIFKGYDAQTGFHCYDSEGSLVWSVATTEEERAIKVVNEKRGQLIAMGVWGDNKATKKLLRAGDSSTYVVPLLLLF